ncbi:MAG TPA: nicotinamide-nucleotide amidohydrolase family protein [Steroidobacteraceae bacterium]|nr:nicotinamide-nucleotide amidohydrolase family protein [Steroidobacteraceae bacterium]
MESLSDNELALLAVRVGAALKERGLVAVTAESCTGGYVAKLLTDVPGSSGWFDSGLVTYSNTSKQRYLGVTAETLRLSGAVSERTVQEMAQGALAVSGADLAVAISGVAGPDGGTADHPVGDVWFARARRRPGGAVELGASHRRFQGSRDDIRRLSAAYALRLLLDD